MTFLIGESMESQDNTASISNLDKAGIACSSLCAVHCALLPLVAIASPTVSNFFESEWIHIGLLILATPIAIVAFCRGRSLHKNSRPLKIGLFGLAFLFAAVAAEALFGHEAAHDIEVILTSIGCIVLIIAHVSNTRSLKSYCTQKKASTIN